MKKIVIVYFLLLLLGCKVEQTENSDYEENTISRNEEELPIGKFSIFDTDKYVFSQPLKGMNRSQRIDFKLGERLFKTSWVPAPASTSGLDGLGPTFNAKSCSRCHIRNGRGQPLEKSTTQSIGFLMRLSVSGVTSHGAPVPVEGYGTQLQDIGILRVKGEADLKVSYEIIEGKYPDGTTYKLRKPTFRLENPRYGALPKDLKLSPRIGQQAIGLGFIDGLSEQEILKNADENDANEDGISGKANYVWNVREQKTTIGKFGWKANSPTVEQQSAEAFHQDMGITTPLFPDQNCPSPQTLCQSLPTGDDGGSEVSSQGLKEITFFLSTLAVPAQRNSKDKNVVEGRLLFNKLNCIACHRTGLKVTQSKVFPKMNGTTINPYSDFLLHDMGEGLADNRTDYLANGKEWRTQALWGIGMIKTVNGHTFLLHDGRARSIEEAILWHGGEAENPKKMFMSLPKEDREALLAFVRSL